MEVSKSVIRRLPRYYRALGDLLKKDYSKISSKELSNIMGLTASQIRQDLNCFGGFGQQGYGYSVKELYQEIGEILGINKPLKTILIGTGNLGKTIAEHIEFSYNGFELIGLFDNNDRVIGQKIANLEIMDINNIKKFCIENKPSVAVLCIPKKAAENIAPILINSGVKGFWNFSHYNLVLYYDDVIVENVHLDDSLMALAFGVNSKINK